MQQRNAKRGKTGKICTIFRLSVWDVHFLQVCLRLLEQRNLHRLAVWIVSRAGGLPQAPCGSATCTGLPSEMTLRIRSGREKCAHLNSAIIFGGLPPEITPWPQASAKARNAAHAPEHLAGKWHRRSRRKRSQSNAASFAFPNWNSESSAEIPTPTQRVSNDCPADPTCWWTARKHAILSCKAPPCFAPSLHIS